MERRSSQVKKEEEKDVVVDGPLEMMKRKKVVGMESGSSSTFTKCCQIERCTADMRDAKPYHKRHKVCEAHAKAEFVLLGGTRQRFCQQCSRFHGLSDFDDSKRSCRWRLAGHNERRRKSTTNPAESNSSQKMASSSQLMEENPLCGGKADSKEKGHIKYPGKGSTLLV